MNRNLEGRLLGFMFNTQYNFSLKSLYALGVDEKSSLTLTPDSMLPVGGVRIYKSLLSRVPERLNDKLNFGPIFKKTLSSDKTYSHFSKLSFKGSKKIVITEGNIIEK